MAGTRRIPKTSGNLGDPSSISLSPSMLPPLVLVEGFCSISSSASWGPFESFLHPITENDITSNVEQGSHKKRRFIFASVGPVSSLHDRACELYYALKGGRVDYGEAHSAEAGHSRYGRLHEEGLYPEWSASNSIHFLGHSMGGPTILYLAWLIQQGHFGKSAHLDMILSVTSVSSPFRGTPLAYILGEKYQSAPAIRTISLGNLLGSTIHFLSYFSPLTRYLPSSLILLDFHSDSRNLGFAHTSVKSLFKNMLKSSWGASRDSAPWDLTFTSSDEREAMNWATLNAKTWYRSYVSCMTEADSPGVSSLHRPVETKFHPFYISSTMLGRFDYYTIHPRPLILNKRAGGAQSRQFSLHGTQVDHAKEELEDGRRASQVNSTVSPDGIDTDSHDGSRIMHGEELWANDGAVPVFSQWHPGGCSDDTCIHYSNPPEDPKTQPWSDSKAAQLPRPGIWHVVAIEEPSNHSSIIPFWKGTEKQIRFWKEMGRWLDDVEAATIQVPPNITQNT